ncbi:MAG: undecaprenyldiphospho-muramoylpentapeptide beta-N-acetylglucosaminyltransferase [Bergeyella sp.]|nr:undecaprenyldiphospho-muramoylpentapeptide beta-N-acetylglucosaminyltransferase [Bergeyella sp.]
MSKGYKILISGGGTGGHIFPALAIAEEIKKRFPDAEFLFIGAKGRMEMEKVPQEGYKIEGLNIAGLNRKNKLKNLSLSLKLISSLLKARQIITKFNPDFAIGTGGFASGPALFMARILNIPIYIQEQNSVPGKTNLFNGRKARAVFTAYPDMDHFFPSSQTFYLGNPVRKSILSRQISPYEARKRLGLKKDELTILSVGGSQGSRAINNAWKAHLRDLEKNNIQLVWQVGALDYKEISAFVNSENLSQKNLIIIEFIKDMATAYSAADIIVSRAGAIAISELCLVGKPVILLPLPTAAKDHQTKNAQVLVEKNAAKMVRDEEIKEKFWEEVMSLCKNKTLREELANNLKRFAKPEATENIVTQILKTIQ